VRPLSETTVLVTGATDGLGKALALELASNGAAVLIHGRDEDRIERTLDELRQRGENDRIRSYRADFASLRQVGELAQELLANEQELHLLVNNAGIGTDLPGGGERGESEDGIELRFAVNYLAPFLLTQRVLPLLRSSAPARIVNVSSAGQAPLDFDDVMLERRYSGGQAYGQSKLAQVMFTLDVAAELDGSGVTANCLHPGTYMPTKMVHAAGIEPMDSLESGMLATKQLVTSPDLERVTGRYFDRLRESRALGQAYDDDARRRLRALSEQLVRRVE
jgi:NAD(P)-dependent dehydrogenase (short-subunit alcohol dehydrogenase family)